ncbi:MAG: hypothetical protein IJ649_09055 [Oscillospiraceae bacterium]|nr:hypothetical protein [Oscillospiraceae bacterium]
MMKWFFSPRALLIVLCCAVLLGGVILGGADSGEASAADQAAETSIDKVYSISYEDFNHVKPGPSVTTPPAEPQG